MTAIVWDALGERVYQTGIDRGVLYLEDGSAVPWNGLTSIDDGSNPELKSYYMDGIKILDDVTPGEFTGKLKAVTYPDEFDRVQGIVDDAPGLSFYEQPVQTFGLTYRTRVGNDLDEDAGYKIHLLYNMTAMPDSSTFDSLSDKTNLIEFSWALTGVPPIITDYRPTTHIVIDSTKAASDAVSTLENLLYGTAESVPILPPASEIRAIFGTFGVLIITDNGDGTWTADDVGDDYITMLDATTFQIDGADATYSDPVTYDISTTGI